jgi:hypothetical protein
MNPKKVHIWLTFLICVKLAVCTELLPQGGWPVTRHDLQRTGRAPQQGLVGPVKSTVDDAVMTYLLTLDSENVHLLYLFNEYVSRKAI